MLENMSADPYSERVRRMFDDPRHAGDLVGDYQYSEVAKTDGSATGDSLTIAVGANDGLIVAARFRADACPHLIAAAEVACTDLENQAINDLRNFDPQEIMRRLSVPPEKIGKILVLEDVLLSLARQFEQSIQE